MYNIIILLHCCVTVLLFLTTNHNGNQSNVVEHYKKYVVFGKGVVNSAMCKTDSVMLKTNY